MMAQPEEPNYALLPETLRPGVRRWIEQGIRPGGFLQAVMRNDLKDAVTRADDGNLTRLLEIVRFFHNEAPRGCYGSEEWLTSWESQFNGKPAPVAKQTDAAAPPPPVAPAAVVPIRQDCYTKHQHKAVPEESIDRSWIYCVTPEECAARPERQQAHGNIMITDVCRCGATRRSESNAGMVNYGPWG